MTTRRDPAADVVRLLAAARHAGITLTAGRTVDVDGPPGTARLVAALRAHPGALANVVHVYSGMAPLLDWRNACRAVVIAPPRPCLLCQQPAGLLDPYGRQPHHKTCVEQTLKPRPAHLSTHHQAAA